MSRLISDRAQAEISKRVLDILRAYMIDDWQSEPHHQHQNPAERRYQTIKMYVERILDRSGAPPDLWLLCMTYVCFLLNRLASKALNNMTPFQMLNGYPPDISSLLQYKFYEPVYFRDFTRNSFPDDTKERLGYWVGISEHVGDELCYKVLSDDTRKIIHTSELRPASGPNAQNLRANPPKGEISDQKILSDRQDLSESPRSMPTVDPKQLIGRTFLTDEDDNRERHRARIRRILLDDTNREDPSYDNVRFILKLDGDQADQIVGYNQVIDQLNKHLDNEVDPESGEFFQFRDLLDHKGPLTPDDPEYNGSTFNVLVLWETGEQTWEPLHVIGNDDPATCAKYARDKGLMNVPGWKRFKRYAKREKILQRVSQSTC
jgi:hypothetical protein